MTSRERVAAVLSGEVPDRVPLDSVYWQTTEDRWRQEGLPEGISPSDYFETNEMARLRGDYSMQFPVRVVEEEESQRTYWDENGALVRDLHTDHGWTSQWLDYTIKTKEDWRKHRDRLQYNNSRISDSVESAWRHARDQDKACLYTAHACFHPTWSRIGMIEEMILMKQDPEFVRELYSAHTQLVIDIFEGMLDLGIDFDGVFIADDLGYVAGPLISPSLYRELVFPFHRRLCSHFSDHGLKTILHSDGDIRPLIPHFLDAGFAGLNPLEAKAGLDVRDLKPEYGGRLVLHGNVDVRKLAGTRSEIEEEISSKISAVKTGGGYIYACDHSVPNDISFDNYCFAMDLVKQHAVY